MISQLMTVATYFSMPLRQLAGPVVGGRWLISLRAYTIQPTLTVPIECNSIVNVSV